MHSVASNVSNNISIKYKFFIWNLCTILRSEANLCNVDIVLFCKTLLLKQKILQKHLSLTA